MKTLSAALSKSETFLLRRLIVEAGWLRERERERDDEGE